MEIGSKALNTVLLSGHEFKILTEQDKSTFYTYLDRERFPTIHQTFGYCHSSNREGHQILWKILNNTLCIFKYYRNRIVLMARPIGMTMDNCETVIYQIQMMIREVNNSKGKLMAENIALDELELKTIETMDFRIKPALLGQEYVYDINQVVAMRGRKFEQFRRRVRAFRENNQFELVKRIDETSISTEGLTMTEVRYIKSFEALYDRWLNQWNERQGTIGLIYDHHYFTKSIIDYKKINQSLILTMDGENPIGMAGIIPMNNGFCMCLNRKSMTEYKGLSEYLLYESCVEAQALGFDYINDSWDANQLGLARFKKKANPVMKIKLYNLIHY